MSLDYSWEPLIKVRGELEDLIGGHWEEVALDRDTVPLSPRWDIYEKMSGAGMLHIFTAREGASLVGYAVYILVPALHYSTQMVAESDVFYLLPAHRRGRNAVEMFRFAEDFLIGLGAKKFLNRVKVTHNVGPVFRRMGYDCTEHVWTRTVK